MSLSSPCLHHALPVLIIAPPRPSSSKRWPPLLNTGDWHTPPCRQLFNLQSPAPFPPPPLLLYLSLVGPPLLHLASSRRDARPRLTMIWRGPDEISLLLLTRPPARRLMLLALSPSCSTSSSIADSPLALSPSRPASTVDASTPLALSPPRSVSSSAAAPLAPPPSLALPHPPSRFCSPSPPSPYLFLRRCSARPLPLLPLPPPPLTSHSASSLHLLHRHCSPSPPSPCFLPYQCSIRPHPSSLYLLLHWSLTSHSASSLRLLLHWCCSPSPPSPCLLPRRRSIRPHLHRFALSYVGISLGLSHFSLCLPLHWRC